MKAGRWPILCAVCKGWVLDAADIYSRTKLAGQKREKTERTLFFIAAMGGVIDITLPCDFSPCVPQSTRQKLAKAKAV
jgi:hypothetical protein